MIVPEWVRMINYLGPSVGGADNLISLDSDDLLELSKKITGLSDFGEDAWQESYVSYLGSMANPRALHTLGRLITRTSVLRVLTNRLCVVGEFKSNPDIGKQRIESPVFITGNPRTGTSILFELLSLDDSLHSPTAWEVMCPVLWQQRREGEGISQPEIAQSVYDFSMEVQPESRHIGEVSWRLPTECYQIMEPCFLQVMNGATSYDEWVKKSNLKNAYAWHEIMLKLLQHQKRNHDATWLLKCPLHIHALDKLFEFYPDARVIITHRDPADSMTSLISFHEHLSSVVTNHYKIQNPALQIMPWCEGLNRFAEARKNGVYTDRQIIDVLFSEFMDDVFETMDKVYQFLGLEFGEQQRNRVAQYLNEKQLTRQGGHKYAKDDLAERDRIQKQFGQYIDYFGVKIA